MAESKKVVIDVDVESGDAIKRLDALESAMLKTQEEAGKMKEQMAGGFDAAGKGAKGAAKGMKGFGTSIGGVLKSLGLIAVAMEIFMFLKELLMKNQKVVDALSTAFKVIEVLFGKLTDAIEPMGKVLMDAFENPQQALEDLWSAIKTNFLNRIKGIAVAAEAVGKVIKAAFELDWDGVKEGMQQYGQALIQVTSGLDIEQQNAFVKGVVEVGTEALNTASKITELTNAVKLAEAQQGLLMLEYQREAEIQRQIRDDVSLTIAERQAANRELGNILDRQSKDELALSNKRKKLADLELSINKTSIDAQVNVINARKEIADVNERITGQRSEQLTNENSLKLEGIQISKDRIKQLEEEAQAEADSAYATTEAKIAAQDLLDTYKAQRESLSVEETMQAEINAAIAAEELKFKAAQDAATSLGIFQDEINELELASIDERLRLENEIRMSYAEKDIALEEKIAEKEIAIAEKRAEEEKKIEDKRTANIKKAEEDKAKAREAGLSVAGSVLNSLGQLVALSGNQSKEAVAIQKAFAVAQVAIDTAKAISAAIAGGTQAGAQTGVAAPITTPIFIASMIATVLGSLAQVGTILATVPGGGSPSIPSSVSVPQSTAPSIDSVSTNTTEIGGADQAQLAPVQAYVVETEMTGNQNNVNQIESQATFGE